MGTRQEAMQRASGPSTSVSSSAASKAPVQQLAWPDTAAPAEEWRQPSPLSALSSSLQDRGHACDTTACDGGGHPGPVPLHVRRRGALPVPGDGAHPGIKGQALCRVAQRRACGQAPQNRDEPAGLAGRRGVEGAPACGASKKQPFPQARTLLLAPAQRACSQRSRRPAPMTSSSSTAASMSTPPSRSKVRPPAHQPAHEEAACTTRCRLWRAACLQSRRGAPGLQRGR